VTGAHRFALALALLCIAPLASAREPEDSLTFRADHLDADPKLGHITLEGNVVLRYGRYRLTGDRLEIVVADGAITFNGNGRVALCPCANPPFTLAFRFGRLSRTGDITLRFPRLELFRAPILGLPWLWLRAPEKPGLLPPIVALRGADGLLIGAGIHLPWRGEGSAIRSLDLTAAGLTRGGVEVGASLHTPSSTARITFDRVQGNRLALEARGSITTSSFAGIAWDADAIRGDRARSGTIDLAAASAPFDHAAAETALRAPGPLTALFAGGFVARAQRGDGAAAAGPRASASLGGRLGSLGTWEAGANGLVLAGARMESPLPIGRASLGAEINGRPGPFALHLAVFGRALAAGRTSPLPNPLQLDATASARLGIELPLLRSFGAARGEGPLLHWIAPAIEIGGMGAVQRGDLFRPLFAKVAPAAALALGGVSTALGRYAGPSVRLSLRAGMIASKPSPAAALALARLTADAPFAAATVDVAATSGTAAGATLIAHTRLGTARGPAVLLDIAAEGGDDPRAARSIESIAGAAPSAELSAFAGPGTTLGAGVALPFPAVLRTTLHADVDLHTARWLAVTGHSEYRHPCGCLSVGLGGAYRIGRKGLDLALSLDLAPSLRAALLR